MIYYETKLFTKSMVSDYNLSESTAIEVFSYFIDFFE